MIPLLLIKKYIYIYIFFENIGNKKGIILAKKIKENK